MIRTYRLPATFLGAVGIFGATHRVVSARRRELGVRLALGAQPRQILVTVLGRIAAAAAVGLIAGGATAFVSSSVLESFLYDIAARDLPTHAGTLAFLFLLCLAASWVPARRVARLELSPGVEGRVRIGLSLDRRRSTASSLRPSYVSLIQGDYPCGRLRYSPGCCL